MKYILAIDDDEKILFALHECIADLGYGVKVAHNGEEGLKLFKYKYNFDMVITDINMPLLDGNEVAKHIKDSDKSDIPIIAITGSYADIINPDLFSIILLKPFSLSILKQAIRRFIRKNSN